MGFLVGRYQNKIVGVDETLETGLKVKTLNQRAINSPSLNIPTKKILDRLTDKGYLRKMEKSNRYKGKGVG